MRVGDVVSVRPGVDGEQRGNGVVRRLHEVRGAQHLLAIAAQRLEDALRILHATQPRADEDGVGGPDARLVGDHAANDQRPLEDPAQPAALGRREP